MAKCNQLTPLPFKGLNVDINPKTSKQFAENTSAIFTAAFK